MISMNRFVSAAAALALTGFATAAPAQSDGQQQQRKPITPTTMKTFAGWDVRCYPVQTPAPCDMWEAIAFKKGGQLAVSVSIVYVPSREEHLLQFVVPLGIDLAKGAKVVTDGYTSESYHFHHCDRIGCYIIVPQGNPVIDALKSQAKMKVQVSQFHGRTVDLDVPLKGFNDAHNALVELARQKANNGGSAPAPAADDTSGNP
ncbi:MAG TPA: invasion associated locus B family protein [Rhizomicrobium sp.]|nr:invasion associated locus B family protein [Rhizomicrobium sp.]